MTQPSLFDQPIPFNSTVPEDQPIASPKNASEGWRLAVSGAETAYSHKSEEWKTAAHEAVRQACLKYKEFTPDVIWELMPESLQRGERRALGGVMMRAKNMGLIAKTNTVAPSTRPSRHSCPANVWKSLLYGGAEGMA